MYLKIYVLNKGSSAYNLVISLINGPFGERIPLFLIIFFKINFFSDKCLKNNKKKRKKDMRLLNV